MQIQRQFLVLLTFNRKKRNIIARAADTIFADRVSSSNARYTDLQFKTYLQL